MRFMIHLSNYFIDKPFDTAFVDFLCQNVKFLKDLADREATVSREQDYELLLALFVKLYINTFYKVHGFDSTVSYPRALRLWLLYFDPQIRYDRINILVSYVTHNPNILFPRGIKLSLYSLRRLQLVYRNGDVRIPSQDDIRMIVRLLREGNLQKHTVNWVGEVLSEVIKQEFDYVRLEHLSTYRALSYGRRKYVRQFIKKLGLCDNVSNRRMVISRKKVMEMVVNGTSRNGYAGEWIIKRLRSDFEVKHVLSKEFNQEFDWKISQIFGDEEELNNALETRFKDELYIAKSSIFS